ncbi:EAL domain-containing protein, partial [Escherichia coli]|uniref:EAL domain-containing protein n=1 Tax=Escherichia coli TaxID=562 RepID=UPI0015EB9C67
IKIAVNISPLQMKNDQFVSRLKTIIEREKITPENLEIEITESIFIQDKLKAVAKLNEIKALGIKIAMDDFGTGYSSLSYLLDLPIDKLKIDKSFVDEIKKDQRKTDIVGSIIEMTHRLKINVVAEGVETR